MSTKKLSRRHFLRLSAAGAGGALLVANGLDFTKALAQTAEPGTAQAGTVTLNVYVHANHPFDAVKPLFEKKYPNVKLNMMGTNDMKVFRTALAAGETDPSNVPDIFWPEPFEVQDLGKSGALFDTSALIEKYKTDLIPGKLTECFIPSTKKYAAVPGALSVSGLYYRKDLWDKAKISIPDDWTWDEFIDASKEVKKATGAYTMFLPLDGSGFASMTWQYILFQLGGSITNADGTKVTLDDDKGIAAMTLIKKIYDAGIAINDGLFSETYYAAMKAGKIAATPQPDWYRKFIMEDNIKTEADGLGLWRVALLPRVEKGGIRVANFGGANTASTKYTAHPQEVSDFMEFAHMTVEGSAAIALQNIPSYLPYLKTDDFLKITSPLTGDFEFNKVWQQAIDQYPTTWYKTPVFLEATNEVDAKLPDIMKGKTDIPTAMKAIGDTARKLNERYQG